MHPQGMMLADSTDCKHILPRSKICNFIEYYVFIYLPWTLFSVWPQRGLMLILHLHQYHHLLLLPLKVVVVVQVEPHQTVVGEEPEEAQEVVEDQVEAELQGEELQLELEEGQELQLVEQPVSASLAVPVPVFLFPAALEVY